MVWLQSAPPLVGVSLLFLRISALYTPEQYHFINASLTWNEAQSFCRLKHSDLATVKNMDDNNELIKALDGHAANSWIGLYRGGSRRWMWSDGRGVVDYLNWAPDEPNNLQGNEWCGEKLDTGLWNDLPCEDKQGVVCYERQPDGTETFIPYTDPKSWTANQELCRTAHTDMAYESASVHVAKPASAVWIGMFSDAWAWSDGSAASFRFWLNGSPAAGNCVYAAGSRQGRWAATSCDEKAAFVCRGGLKLKKRFIKLTLRSHVDLNEPKVRDAILQKLETKLRDRSVTDFSLRWKSDKTGTVFKCQKDAKKEDCDRRL